jgi:hypothetical protein
MSDAFEQLAAANAKNEATVTRLQKVIAQYLERKTKSRSAQPK